MLLLDSRIERTVFVFQYLWQSKAKHKIATFCKRQHKQTKNGLRRFEICGACCSALAHETNSYKLIN